jgi:phosphopantetheine--protein transferase-like protein
MNHQDSQNSTQLIQSPALWVAYLEDFHEDQMQNAFENFLSPEERVKNERYRHDRDRRLHLMARWMCRTILSRYEPEIEPFQWQFQPNIHGKPEVTGPKSMDGILYFNITHTEGVVVMAISRSGQVGVDVERVGRPMDYLGMSRRFFAEIEAEAVSNISEAERSELFYRIWTLKEAYVKAIGKGLAHALDSFWFSPMDLNHLYPQLQLVGDDGDAINPIQDWEAQVIRLGHDNRWIVSVVNEVKRGTNNDRKWSLFSFSNAL